MTALWLVAALTCPGVLVDDRVPTVPWTDRDEAALTFAESGCRRRYGPRACLVRFARVAPQTYHATCRR